MQLAGELTKISLPSLIQLLRNGQLTGKVCFTQGTNTAFLYVENGRLVHAETDKEIGRFALLELFLWMSGSFSFVAADVQSLVHTLSPDEPIDKTVREGLAYLDKKKFLDQLRIGSRTVLRREHERGSDEELFLAIDGKRTLGDIVSSLALSRYEYLNCVHELLSRGLVSVVDLPASSEEVQLPPWVISRLKQDNPDVSQAIVQMVIWVDRVKCWMYQADADLERIVDQLSPAPSPDLIDRAAATEAVEVDTAAGANAEAKPAAGVEF